MAKETVAEKKTGDMKGSVDDSTGDTVIFIYFIIKSVIDQFVCRVCLILSGKWPLVAEQMESR